MSDTILKIAVILSAYDKLSGVVDDAVGKAQKKLMALAGTKFMEGTALIASGMKLGKMLDPAIEAFADAQEAGNELKASMMGPGGVLDEATYKKIYGFANNMSDKYKASTASYLEMVTVLKNNRINEADILGGVGEANAKLADLFKSAPAVGAEFFAHMKNDMDVKVGEMDNLADFVSRVHHAGVGITGSDAIMQMNDFFSKASIGARNLGVAGLEASKPMGALGALFITKGLTGATVGTNFRRIFDAIRDPGKLDKVNAAAAQYGKHLNIFRHGKFVGMDEFVNQIGKLESLNPQAVSAILKPLGGKQGLSTDFLEYLGHEGLKGYADFTDKMKSSAEYGEMLQVMMGGLNYQQEVMNTSWTNLKSSFGSSMQPVLSAFYEAMNKIIVTLRHFLDEHPKVAKFASAFIALSSAALMLAGVIKIIQGIRIAMTALNFTMTANPFIAVAMAVIIAASLIYTYWDEIVAFFKRVWNNIKSIFGGGTSGIASWFSKMWDKVVGIFGPAMKVIKFLFMNFPPIGWIIQLWNPMVKFFKAIFSMIWEVIKLFFRLVKFAFLNFTPLGLIIKYWGPLKKFFTALFSSIGNALLAFGKFLWKAIMFVFGPIFAIGKMMFEAGANIINSIISGITSGITKITNVIKNITKKIRDFFPFSPAKEGPLKDIHRVKLIETVAQSIKPGSLVTALKKTTGVAFNYLNSGVKMPALSGGGFGGGMNFNVTVNLSGGASKSDATLVAAECKKQFQQWMLQYKNQQSRVGY